MRIRFVGLFLVGIAAACGGSSSSTPPDPAPSGPTAPPVTTWSIGGAVTDAMTGHRVPGATVAVAGFPPFSADNGGNWQLQGTGASPGAAVLVTTITAPGFLDRETRIEWKAGGRADVVLSLLPATPPFSLDFFRQLVRNGHEEPESLEALRRWTTNPNFYLNAYNPRTEEKLKASEVEMIERVIREAVPQLTGGLLSAGSVEVGGTERTLRPGYINIDIVYDPAADFCGTAFVGANPGRIRLNYDRCRVNWCNEGISPNVVAHEVGHAMGFWHVPDGIMVSHLDDCKGTRFTDAEQLHARAAYQRPVGNRDVDKDPETFWAVTADNAPEVVCHNAPRR